MDLKANSLSTVNSGREYNPRLFDVHIKQSLNGVWIYGQRKPGYFRGCVKASFLDLIVLILV